MADIETSVAITAQTDDLQSGMQRAASSVEAATEAMKAQFAGLGAAARQAQSHIGAAAGQIGSTLGALQAKAANLAGSAGSGVAQLATASRGRRGDFRDRGQRQFASPRSNADQKGRSTRATHGKKQQSNSSLAPATYPAARRSRS